MMKTGPGRYMSATRRGDKKMLSYPRVIFRMMFILTLVALTICVMACGTSSGSRSLSQTGQEIPLRPPEPIQPIQAAPINPIWMVSPSIDQQILDSTVIVIASLVSVTPSVQTVPGDTGVAPTYRPMQILRFMVDEYIKGNGPSEFTVAVSKGYQQNGYLDGDHHYSGYLTEAKALQSATEAVAQRNTTYDDRPGVLFLHGPLTSLGSSSGGELGKIGETTSTKSFGFVLSNHIVQSSFDYDINTLSRAWLPAKTTTSAQTKLSTNTEFITDGSKTPNPVLSLGALKTRISEIDAMLKAGEGIEGYAECIYSSLTRERHYRNWIPVVTSVTIQSGLAEESINLEKESGDPYYDAQVYNAQYNGYWVSGLDVQYFKTVIKDEDGIASNGYRYVYTIARPLPKGIYEANFHQQHYSKMVCGFKPGVEDKGYSAYNVTVEAPGGTLHEAFFDPVEGGEDEVSPASFSVGGTATEITGLDWADGKVVLSLNPVVSLDGYTLDFIELDGTASLNLRGLDVAERSRAGDGSGTLKWAVADEPWEDGDKLMLRIREDGAAAPPTPEPTPTPTPTPSPTPTRIRRLSLW